MKAPLLLKSNEKIVAGLKQGDEGALKSVFNHLHEHVFFTALKFLKSDDLAKEVVQDVFIKLWESRKRLDANKSLEAYIMTICRNHIFNILKKAKRDSEILKEIYTNQPLKQESALDEIIFNDYKEIAQKAIESLPEKRKKIFLLCKEDGKSYAEIAQSLNISTGTVRDHIVKAGKTIRAYLTTNAELNI